MFSWWVLPHDLRGPFVCGALSLVAVGRALLKNCRALAESPDKCTFAAGSVVRQIGRDGEVIPFAAMIGKNTL